MRIYLDCPFELARLSAGMCQRGFGTSNGCIARLGTYRDGRSPAQAEAERGNITAEEVCGERAEIYLQEAGLGAA
jgi:hypothetical protein